jgi:hypothetical protein
LNALLPWGEYCMDETNSDSRTWRIASWLVVLGFWAIGAWFSFDIPSVGKGGIFLAVGATLMPLFWNKTREAGQMTWILMLFLFLSVEYRAINKEQANNIGEQKKNIDDQAMIQKRFDDTMTRFDATTTKLGAIQQFTEQITGTSKQTLGHIKSGEARAKESESKRQEIRDELTRLLYRDTQIRGLCQGAGPVGSGGHPVAVCEQGYKTWLVDARTFVTSLGDPERELFVDSKLDMANAGVDSRVKPEIKFYIADLIGKADVLSALILEYRN